MLEQPWELNGSVAIRPEPFGALLYDFTTRRLTFLKDRRLVAVVEGLADAPTVGDALERAGVPAAERAGFDAALHRLAEQRMITRRTA
ncbi:mycofactocin biosynthesis chaperone MftB [Phycicoccus sonneratiae]|uniref:Mycofactocin biosynthesis chaperone MftB n=1 Tax=Phycicoccus sonneratiae TaxID=2807628 RepID=A0ABS2CJK9_9MICO|nr:mycofactocin biosynthesis chaperone MftB [Phycicoccus sonneraticus]MBM6400071.1 mycofactocin biosynthesis chaperone MftB [Phycicoccus sonneraticus]